MFGISILDSTSAFCYLYDRAQFLVYYMGLKWIMGLLVGLMVSPKGPAKHMHLNDPYSIVLGNQMVRNQIVTVF